jgi:hypothetical protein
MAASSEQGARPRVVPVFVENGGEFQMAAGLMCRVAASAVDVDSARHEAGRRDQPCRLRSWPRSGVDISDRTHAA